MQPHNLLIPRHLCLVSAIAAMVLAVAVSSPARAGGLGHFFSGSGKQASQTYSLKGFDRIETTGVYDLQVNVGSKFAIQLSGSKKELAEVDVRVEDGRLVLKQRGHTNLIGFHRHGITAKISLPKLSGLDVTGVGDAYVTGVLADAFSAKVRGVGDVRLSGTCKDLTVRVSGIGDFDSRKLHCKSANVQVSGIGDVSVYANLVAGVRSSGIGDVNIYGSPKVVVKHGHLLSDIQVH